MVNRLLEGMVIPFAGGKGDPPAGGNGEPLAGGKGLFPLSIPPVPGMSLGCSFLGGLDACFHILVTSALQCGQMISPKLTSPPHCGQ